MKYWLIFSLILVFCGCNLNDDKSRIIFFGDSLTELGTLRNGYLTLMKKKLRQHGKDGKYLFIGAGISGNKVTHLQARLKEDVLDKKPAAVVIWVGTNDIILEDMLPKATYSRHFIDVYTNIIQQLKGQNIQILLCTPAMIGEKPDFTNAMDSEILYCNALIKKLATEYHLLFIDLRKTFLQYNAEHNKEKRESGILTTDGVHLTDIGNELTAAKLYEELDKAVLK